MIEQAKIGGADFRCKQGIDKPEFGIVDVLLRWHHVEVAKTIGAAAIITCPARHVWADTA